MKEWEIAIKYNSKTHLVKALVEYKSNSIMRIRVHGRHSTLLLENDYPSIRISQSKKGVRWRLREGKTDFAGQQSATILLEMFQQLEDNIKRDFVELYPDILLWN